MPVGSMFICKPLCRGLPGKQRDQNHLRSGSDATSVLQLLATASDTAIKSGAGGGALQLRTVFRFTHPNYGITEFRKILLLLFDLNYGISENTVVTL